MYVYELYFSMIPNGIRFRVYGKIIPSPGWYKPNIYSARSKTSKCASFNDKL